MREERDPDDPRIALHVVNNPRNRDRYREPGIDRRFAEVLDRVRPDIVHVGHLNHLSTSLPFEAAARSIPVVYTLHDYWPMCPRGQFMQTFPLDPEDPWAACDGQEDRKCAERCYARYFGGAPDEREADAVYWTGWVGRRMRHVREMTELVDCFIAPARYLLDRYRDGFGLPASKLVHLDYGFDLARLGPGGASVRRPARIRVRLYRHAYSGQGDPAPDPRLRGRRRRGPAPHLGPPAGPGYRGAQGACPRAPGGEGRPRGMAPRIPQRGHRARRVRPRGRDRRAVGVGRELAAGDPRGAAGAGSGDRGGRRRHGRICPARGQRSDLRAPLLAVAGERMQQFVDDPALARRLGRRGYLYTENGDVPAIEDHVRAVERIYERVLERRDSARIKKRPGPWRITFDTNPDTCNMRCVMCEEHSPHSPLQAARRREGRPRRTMPVDLIRRVVADAAPHGLREIIPSTMGEPLLYEHFEEILALCSEYGVRLNLTTNGTFPRLGAKAWAERIVPVASDVKISWNGATKATHEAIMIGARWERVLENVGAFVAVRDAHAAGGGNRCRVTFQLTFMEANVAELAGIVRLAARLGVDRVKGHHLWTHFREIEAQSMRRNPDAVRRWNEAVLGGARSRRRRTCCRTAGRCCWRTSTSRRGRRGTTLPPAEPCPFLGREAWVSAEGRFDPVLRPRRGTADAGRVRQSARPEPDGHLARRRLPDAGGHVPQPVAVPRLQHAQARGTGSP